MYDYFKPFAESATMIRKGIIEASYSAQLAHPEVPLSIADILSVLYLKEMNVSPLFPQRSNRDQFILLKKHCKPALYAALALKGFFPFERLKFFKQSDCHPDIDDMSSYPLVQGLSSAYGIARNAKQHRVYILLSDTDIFSDNQIYEAIKNPPMVYNLVAIVSTSPSSPPLDEKFESFGWHVITIDAHNFKEITKAFKLARLIYTNPTLIIAETIKGTGISFIKDNGWHGKAMNTEEYNNAIRELNK